MLLKNYKKEYSLLTVFLTALFLMCIVSCGAPKKSVKKPAAKKRPAVSKKDKQPKPTKRSAYQKPKLIFREGTEAKVGSVVPAIVAISIKGKPVSTSNCEGRVILLNFWSIRCGPCIKEMPYLERLYNEFKSSGLEIIAINTDRASVEKVARFINERPFDLSYNIVADPDLVLSTVFTKWFVPVTILIDSKGVMRYNNTGFTKRDYGKYRKIIKNLIKEQE